MSGVSAKVLKVRRGKYSEHKEEIDQLIKTHWEEVGMPGAPTLEVDVDFDTYLQMEQADRHLGLVIEEGNEIIGYLSIFIYPHHQHKSTMFAQTDGFFVNPKKRGFGTFKKVLEIFKTAESILKNEYGVQYMLMSTNASNDLQFLADCLEFTQSATIYTKRLS